jgi:hypothetical protein
MDKINRLIHALSGRTKIFYPGFTPAEITAVYPELGAACLSPGIGYF